MTLVKDDAARHRGAEESRIAERDRRRRRAGEPKCASILGVPLVLDAFGPPWHSRTN
ncbi:protein of unknown function (plasmid) [Shinella sp. WSC3-e]|nr:hypothetical protein SHINE37_100318 [Rhizobiaceae bacterium]CAK7261870.1 protein of unknown function [Shinella sp. WSC3-e]